jgi:deoxycytidylate deaminase
MALPKLQSITYDIKQPSTKKTIHYRPFTVKEQKFLLIASEEKSNKSFLRVAAQIIESCTFGKVTADTMTPSDLEYIFLKIRGKSVGETSEVIITCPHCGDKLPVAINLDDLKIKEAEKQLSDTITLENGIGVTMKRLTVSDIIELTESTETLDDFDIVKKSIVTIFDDKAIYETANCSAEELDAFIESMTQNQFSKLEQYVSNTQEIYYDVNVPCIHCGKQIVLKLKGISDFF